MKFFGLLGLIKKKKVKVVERVVQCFIVVFWNLFG
jgi:hypothetical protein